MLYKFIDLDYNKVITNEDKEVSPKNNGAKTDLAISATTKPEENNTQTNNEGALCDLKSGICCGCKWW